MPVALIVYNRLSTTARVFERIAAARPERLLVIADGPHPDRPGDRERCETVRALVTKPRWPCELHVDLAEVNLGFNRRIGSGLEWVFEQCEEAIVLEDDCLPDASFFPFCAELLARHRADERVMMITGDNFQFGRRRGTASYYASQGVGTWGWASWRRAFRHFDRQMRAWPDERHDGFLERIWPADVADYWRARLDEAYERRVDAWDYQWAFAMWRRGGLQLVPNVNLVSYIGCLPDTAHTIDPTAPYCALPTHAIELPLEHPASLERDLEADLFEFRRVFLNRSEEGSES